MAAGDDLQAAVNSAPSGSVLRLAPGDYNVGTDIQLKSGVSISCASGAILHSNGSQNIFVISKASNISIWNCDLDGTNTSGGFSAAVFVLNSNNIHINNNNFRNWKAKPYLFQYNSDNFSFSGNTNLNNSGNEYQPVSTIYNDGNAHNHVYFTDNSFSGFSRMGIEAQLDQSYDIHFDRNNLNMNYTGSYSEGIGLSIVSNAGGPLPASGTISDNVIYGKGPWGIELGTENMTVSGNKISGMSWGIIPSSAPGSAILNNILNDAHSFGEDGGYLDDTWYGTNVINGVSTDGWSGHGTSVVPTINVPSQKFCSPQ